MPLHLPEHQAKVLQQQLIQKGQTYSFAAQIYQRLMVSPLYDGLSNVELAELSIAKARDFLETCDKDLKSVTHKNSPPSN